MVPEAFGREGSVKWKRLDGVWLRASGQADQSTEDVKGRRG